MKIILSANETILKILQRFKKTDHCNRMMKYCVQTNVDDGVLLFNLLTRELLLLSEEEYKNFTELDYLRENWFIVPEGANEKEYVDLVKWILTTRQKKPDAITGYTIFPTTDCNARCFYCFELGRSRIPMSHETALKVVQYIKTHCGGEKVSLSWFGGEPLYNQDAIDTICTGLHSEGIEFTSFTVSNGYLFDDVTVKKAVECWNLKRVQITLDGTEAIYNRTKAFIYREGNPYQIVLKNMERLLDASVKVTVRLNLDLYNADDLLMLTEELAQRFGGRKNMSVYVHHLFDGNTPMAELHSGEEWEKRENAMRRIEDKLTQSGLIARAGISKHLKQYHCMADSGKTVTILPDGNIGLCEHFSETEFVGHIDRDGFDTDMVASWKETTPEIPECAECFYLPECIQLRKCANESICFPQFRSERLRKIQRNMVYEYQKWQTHTDQGNDESHSFDDC